MNTHKIVYLICEYEKNKFTQVFIFNMVNLLIFNNKHVVTLALGLIVILEDALQ